VGKIVRRWKNGYPHRGDSIYGPKTWKVSDRYTGTGANVTVTDPGATAGVVDTARNTDKVTDCLYRVGSIIGHLANNRRKKPR